MNTTRIAITLEQQLVRKLDRLVKTQVFPSRSKVIQIAIAEKLSRIDGHRLAEECSKLDLKFEQALAEEVCGRFNEWPEY
jgi:metal-responsive CopG/Arc/MetJ family transcriptional regulator